MQLTWIDWAAIAFYFLLNFAVGLYYRSRAGKSVSEFFLSGRNVPWWLAGTSMVATTFAADTPLAVTGMVARGGIAGNWLWWSFVASGMLTVFPILRPRQRNQWVIETSRWRRTPRSHTGCRPDLTIGCFSSPHTAFDGLLWLDWVLATPNRYLSVI